MVSLHSRLYRAAAVAAATALVITACGSDDDDQSLRDPAAAADAALDEAAAQLDLSVTGDGTTTTLTETGADPVTPTTLPGLVIDQYILTIDECFDRVEALNAGRLGIVTTRLPCDTPHRAQVFSRVVYPADHPSYYPGDDIMEDYALAACYVDFEPWVDNAYETSALEIRAIMPTRDNFESAGYRGIHCYVERLDGEPITGTARGSRL